jgi:hypothetical protein
MRPKYVKVDKLSKPVSQTDYLQMLGEVMQTLKVTEPKPVMEELTRGLPLRTDKKEVKE